GIVGPTASAPGSPSRGCIGTGSKTPDRPPAATARRCAPISRTGARPGCAHGRAADRDGAPRRPRTGTAGRTVDRSGSETHALDAPAELAGGLAFGGAPADVLPLVVGLLTAGQPQFDLDL